MQPLAECLIAEVAGGLHDPGVSRLVDPASMPVCPVAVPPPEW